MTTSSKPGACFKRLVVFCYLSLTLGQVLAATIPDVVKSHEECGCAADYSPLIKRSPGGPPVPFQGHLTTPSYEPIIRDSYQGSQGGFNGPDRHFEYQNRHDSLQSIPSEMFNKPYNEEGMLKQVSGYGSDEAKLKGPKKKTRGKFKGVFTQFEGEPVPIKSISPKCRRLLRASEGGSSPLIAPAPAPMTAERVDKFGRAISIASAITLGFIYVAGVATCCCINCAEDPKRIRDFVVIGQGQERSSRQSNEGHARFVKRSFNGAPMPYQHNVALPSVEPITRESREGAFLSKDVEYSYQDRHKSMQDVPSKYLTRPYNEEEWLKQVSGYGTDEFRFQAPIDSQEEFEDVFTQIEGETAPVKSTSPRCRRLLWLQHNKIATSPLTAPAPAPSQIQKYKYRLNKAQKILLAALGTYLVAGVALCCCCECQREKYGYGLGRPRKRGLIENDENDALLVKRSPSNPITPFYNNVPTSSFEPIARESRGGFLLSRQVESTFRNRHGSMQDVPSKYLSQPYNEEEMVKQVSGYGSNVAIFEEPNESQDQFEGVFTKFKGEPLPVKSLAPKCRRLLQMNKGGKAPMIAPAISPSEAVNSLRRINKAELATALTIFSLGSVVLIGGVIYCCCRECEEARDCMRVLAHNLHKRSLTQDGEGDTPLVKRSPSGSLVPFQNSLATSSIEPIAGESTGGARRSDQDAAWNQRHPSMQELPSRYLTQPYNEEKMLQEVSGSKKNAIASLYWNDKVQEQAPAKEFVEFWDNVKNQGPEANFVNFWYNDAKEGPVLITKEAVLTQYEGEEKPVLSLSRHCRRLLQDGGGGGGGGLSPVIYVAIALFGCVVITIFVFALCYCKACGKLFGYRTYKRSLPEDDKMDTPLIKRSSPLSLSSGQVNNTPANVDFPLGQLNIEGVNHENYLDRPAAIRDFIPKGKPDYLKEMENYDGEYWQGLNESQLNKSGSPTTLRNRKMLAGQPDTSGMGSSSFVQSQGQFGSQGTTQPGGDQGMVEKPKKKKGMDKKAIAIASAGGGAAAAALIGIACCKAKCDKNRRGNRRRSLFDDDDKKPLLVKREY